MDFEFSFKDDTFIFSFYEEWTQLLGGYNWYTITPIHIEFEWDKILGGLDFKIVLLGLSFHFRWNYTETDESKKLQKILDDVIENSSEWG